MDEFLVLRGFMRGHKDVVTAIATPIDNSDTIVTASRDNSIILWDLTKEEKTYPYGMSASRDNSIILWDSKRFLTGHSHFAQDVVLSSDGRFALAGSRDGELRLWDLKSRTSPYRFVGHTKGVLSVALSKDHRQILSASRDGTIKLWNTRGECKYTIDAHSDPVSCVRFSPNTLPQPAIVSASRDCTVKVWNMTNLKLRNTFTVHTKSLKTVAVAPDPTLCAFAGKDGFVYLWDLEEGKVLFSFDTFSIIHALSFCPSRCWLCVATESCTVVWDLKSRTITDYLRVDPSMEADVTSASVTITNKAIYCTSLAWSADGSTLFCGYTDGVIRVWGLTRL